MGGPIKPCQHVDLLFYHLASDVVANKKIWEAAYKQQQFWRTDQQIMWVTGP